MIGFVIWYEIIATIIPMSAQNKPHATAKYTAQTENKVLISSYFNSDISPSMNFSGMNTRNSNDARFSYLKLTSIPVIRN